MTSDITPSGVACTLGVTPRQLVQSSSENDTPTDGRLWDEGRCTVIPPFTADIEAAPGARPYHAARQGPHFPVEQDAHGFAPKRSESAALAARCEADSLTKKSRAPPIL